MAVPDEYQGDDCHSCSSTPSPPPPPLSINQHVALHSRERLLVHPLRWTARQLTLLDCRLRSHGEGSRSVAAHENANVDAAFSRPDHLARLLSRRLNLQLSWEELIDTTRRLLQPLGGRISIYDRYVRPCQPPTRPPRPACTNTAWITKASRSSLLQPTLACQY